MAQELCSAAHHVIHALELVGLMALVVLGIDLRHEIMKLWASIKSPDEKKPVEVDPLDFEALA